MSPIVGSLAGISAQAYGLFAPATLATGNFYSLQTVTLTTATSAITFSSIPQNYTHLQIRASYSNNSVTTHPQIRVGNGTVDTGSNYSWHLLYGNGSSAGSANAVSQTSAYISYVANVSYPIVSIIDIFDYTNTNKNKTIRTLSGNEGNGSGEIDVLGSGWFSTSAISAISILGNTGTFGQYSSFALYGVK